MGTNDIKAFFRVKRREGGIHAESLDNNFKVLLVLVDVSLEINFLDITYINGFIHG